MVELQIVLEEANHFLIPLEVLDHLLFYNYFNNIQFTHSGA